MATLSTGPVGIGDRIGSTNATLVHATMRADGLLLKPDVPALTMEAVFVAAAARTIPGRLELLDELTAAWSAHGPDRAWRWYYVLAANITQAYSLAPADLGPALAATAYVAVDFFAIAGGGGGRGLAKPVNASAALIVAPGNAQPSPPTGAVPVRYYILAPVLGPSGWVLIGEGGGKFVPMSGLRSRMLTVSPTGFSVEVEFDDDGAEQSLEMLVAAPAAPGDVAAVICTRPAAPNVSVTLTCEGSGAAGCTCE